MGLLVALPSWAAAAACYSGAFVEAEAGHVYESVVLDHGSVSVTWPLTMKQNRPGVEVYGKRTLCQRSRRLFHVVHTWYGRYESSAISGVCK